MLHLPSHAIAHLGGHASRKELLTLGCDDTFIKLSLWYRSILPTRRGWYALPGTEQIVLRALRAGGRLACVSALAWYEGRSIPEDEPVHILVPYGASRLGAGAVVHWTRHVITGSRLVVEPQRARRQAESCRARG